MTAADCATCTKPPWPPSCGTTPANNPQAGRRHGQLPHGREAGAVRERDRQPRRPSSSPARGGDATASRAGQGAHGPGRRARRASSTRARPRCARPISLRPASRPTCASSSGGSSTTTRRLVRRRHRRGRRPPAIPGRSTMRPSPGSTAPPRRSSPAPATRRPGGFRGDSRGYVASRLDLSSFAGASVKPRFTMNTDARSPPAGSSTTSSVYTCDPVVAPPPPPTQHRLLGDRGYRRRARSARPS